MPLYTNQVQIVFALPCFGPSFKCNKKSVYSNKKTRALLHYLLYNRCTDGSRQRGPSSYDRGEPAVSYKMNRLSLRNIRLKSKTAGKLPIILEEFIEYSTQSNKGKLEDVNM